MAARKKKEKTDNEKEFEVEGDILKPEFMATKSMVDYAPAEISAVEQYEVKKFSLFLRKHFFKNILCF